MFLKKHMSDINPPSPRKKKKTQNTNSRMCMKGFRNYYTPRLRSIKTTKLSILIIIIVVIISLI